jgi:hypothetical protein
LLLELVELVELVIFDLFVIEPLSGLNVLFVRSLLLVELLMAEAVGQMLFELFGSIEGRFHAPNGKLLEGVLNRTDESFTFCFK